MKEIYMFNGVNLKRFVTFAKEVFQKEGATIIQGLATMLFI